MDQHTTSTFANRFASKRLFAAVLAATFVLSLGITVSVSHAGVEAEATLVATPAALVRTSAGECLNSPLGPDAICKEICLNNHVGQPVPTGDFQCALPGQTTPS